MSKYSKIFFSRANNLEVFPESETLILGIFSKVYPVLCNTELSKMKPYLIQRHMDSYHIQYSYQL